MAQVSITLIRADTNQEFDVELPDDAPIVELLPALVKELGLPITGPDGNQVAYELSNKRTGTEYKEDQTLGSAGTKTGDSLLLTSTFVAGIDAMNCGDCDGLFEPASLICADSAQTPSACKVHDDTCPEVYCGPCFDAG